MILLVLCIWLLNAFDLAFTVYAHQQGVLHEANPVARGMLEGGTVVIMLYKVGMVLIGSYPLMRSGQFIINKSQLTIPAVQSYLWHAFSEDNVRAFQDNGFVGIRLSDLAGTRSTLNTAFDEAMIASLQAQQAEATEEPEATAETTEEASE